MTAPFTISKSQITVRKIYRNMPPAKLYEEALKNELGSAITSLGALTVSSGAKTGRSPKDKRIVTNPDSEKNIWWGAVNQPLDERVFMINRERAIDYLNTKDQIFVVDGFAGWELENRLKVRIICERAYHALFMYNMLIRPTESELATFGEPDYTIYNAGRFPANRYTAQMTSTTSIDLSFEKGEMIILGTEYAGEMKKGVFTVMNYLMPKKGVLSMHCSANEGHDGDVSLFFGLSGTGKTTLSADPRRALIGDDEHCWSDKGVSNIEGGCYAKCINLSKEKEPEIFNAIKFGALLENIEFFENTATVDFSKISKTENTRVGYPIDFIDNAVEPSVGGIPKNIFFLTCDAYGVLPPISKLTPGQAMYHFISGYTAKVAGTEMGITEPTLTFSACFGKVFLPLHPTKYAELLGQKLKKNNVNVWLVNTGWFGGAYGTGSRMKLSYTRAMITAALTCKLDNVKYATLPVFGLQVPTECPDVPAEILNPRTAWKDKNAYDATANKLAASFIKNFEQYADAANEEIMSASPKAAVVNA